MTKSRLDLVTGQRVGLRGSRRVVRVTAVEDFMTLRQRSAAWGLMRYEHAPVAIGLLQRVFIVPNVRAVIQAELVEALEDDLHALRRLQGDQAAPRRALEYLAEWSSNDRGWLRRYFPSGSDEPWFDLTPACEQALMWVTKLVERPFVGTESRLRALFELVDNMAASVETDPEARLAALRRRRAEIDVEIERVTGGDIAPVDERMLREQFLQFVGLARELLGDFRQVEHNFRTLDRNVREKIATWAGAKGDLVGEILGERDAIEGSEQGRSFRAFWEFLMSQPKQEQMTRNLERVLAQPAVLELRPDRRVRRVHYDWLDAGEHTQRTVAQLSAQMRRFLDDATWLENRRIAELLQSIEKSAIAVRDDGPDGTFMHIELPAADIRLPFERPMFEPRRPLALADVEAELDLGTDDLDGLFEQHHVDIERLTGRIEERLIDLGQVTLAELCRSYPVEQGLAELVAYLQLGVDRFETVIDESIFDQIMWSADDGVERTATVPRVVFVG